MIDQLEIEISREQDIETDNAEQTVKRDGP
jgi:hypothetical protein